MGSLKRTTTLRRVELPPAAAPVERAAFEGEVCLFRATAEAPSIVEGPGGRAMTILPGEYFLATPGYRESTRWVVGAVPERGLQPGQGYWVLAGSGIVGEMVGASARDTPHLARAIYIGTVCDGERPLTIADFGLSAPGDCDRAAPLRMFLIVGTSSEVGKTTALTQVLRVLTAKGFSSVIGFKATGTSSLNELCSYRDYGAGEVFDCVDFGVPSTYPSGRGDATRLFGTALSYLVSRPSEAIVIECGGDLYGANVPEFMAVLAEFCAPTVILAASDTSAAIGAKAELSARGMVPALITGPCTDTPTIRQRTQTLTGTPAVNLSVRSPDIEHWL